MSFGGILRQSTAVDVLIGPFVDSTDGDTEEAALTINRADVLLSKNGQGAVQKTDVTAAASDADGFYNCELDATDTDTVGQLVLYVHVAGALAVRHDFQIVEEEPYDDIFAASAVGYLKPTTAGRDLDVSAGGEAGLDWANIGSPTTAVDLSATDIQLCDTTTTNTDMVGTDSALLASSAPTNFGDLSIAVTTGLVNITQAAADKVWSTAARALTDKAGFSLATGGVIDGAIAAAELINIADGLLDRRLDLGTDTGGNTTTSRTWRDALRVLRNRVVIAGGTMTVHEEDDSTVAWTGAVTTASGDPIIEINPS
ncbi:hypothetical protein LCGC14_0794530 [marine sediment metagenome]|uniref:Uncharacterized protein n=1 Tax=marine sediment metagenome TaxID=412755 RepID=A0A0F9QBC8_9ZZZZ